MLTIMTSEDKDDLLFPFQHGCLLFVYFFIFFLIALAKTFSTSLNRSDESRHFLVSDLRKKA